MHDEHRIQILAISRLQRSNQTGFVCLCVCVNGQTVEWQSGDECDDAIVTSCYTFGIHSDPV